MERLDVLIVGAGPSGCAAAAALAESGRSVCVVDALQDRTKQLAGELLHPPAVESLSALGFGEALRALKHDTVRGFVVDGLVLEYPNAEQGVATEHSALVEALVGRLGERRDVRLERAARVTGLRANGDGPIEVGLSDGRRLTARLVVGADGRGSMVRKEAGIELEDEALSSMLGVRVPLATLPHPGFGHLYTGPVLTLAYGIGDHWARVMLDVPRGQGARWILGAPDLLSKLPPPLRAAVLRALAEGPVRAASNVTRVPRALARGRFVLIGDAAGACHPVSASGLASGIADGRALGEAVRASGQSLEAAPAAYARERIPAHRTRVALATALYRAFTSEEPAMQALRAGLMRYWAKSERHIETSMSLLSTRQTRVSVMAAEYSRVVGNALVALTTQGGDLRSKTRAAGGLLGSTAPHLRLAAHDAASRLFGHDA